jgi:hypothetical protein
MLMDKEQKSATKILPKNTMEWNFASSLELENGLSTGN